MIPVPPRIRPRSPRITRINPILNRPDCRDNREPPQRVR